MIGICSPTDRRRLPLIRTSCRAYCPAVATSSQLVERLIRVQEQPPVDLFAAEAGPPDVRPLLVIHGGPDWDHTYLREPLVRLAGHRVLFVDLRGCGRSTKGLGDDAYTPAAATRDLIVVLDALDVEQADVLEFSYGGLIAQRLTLASPSRVRRLVIASSSVLPVPTQKDDAEPRPRSTPGRQKQREGLRWTVPLVTYGTPSGCRGTSTGSTTSGSPPNGRAPGRRARCRRRVWRTAWRCSPPFTSRFCYSRVGMTRPSR